MKRLLLFILLLPFLNAGAQQYSENKCSGGSSFTNSSYGSGFGAGTAFDGDINTVWVTAAGTASTNFWIAYKFYQPYKIAQIRIYPRPGFSNAPLTNFSILASNNSTDGVDGTWTTISSNLNIPAIEQWNNFSVPSQTSYLWYKLSGTGGLIGTDYYANLGEIEMKELAQPKAPPSKFSENKCIGGNAYAQSSYNSDYTAQYAFDGDTTDAWVSTMGTQTSKFWIAYQFNSLQKIDLVRVFPRLATLSASLSNFSIEGSNNSSDGANGTWVTLSSNLNIPPAAQWNEFRFSNANSYKWYRLSGMGGALGGGYYANIGEIQMMEDLFASDPEITIPIPVKISREGRQLPAHSAPSYLQHDLTVGQAYDVFNAPPCLEGQYYVGFQLHYDLGDHTTQHDWKSKLKLAFLHSNDTLWTKSLQVNMTNQTFISTIFHDTLVSCDGDYRFAIVRKDTMGVAPDENIYLNTLLYKNFDDDFNDAAPLTLHCSTSAREYTISWDYAGTAVQAYDLEWVFIDSLDSFNGNTAQAAFAFKEGVRITTASTYYTHLMYYPSGKIFYRARAVGYNPLYPDHRISGQWFYYTPDATTVISNHQRTINWTEQTVFAEEGKYKKILSYFDGSLRQRQSQTNLSTENVTLVGETFYDFEGRQSVNILAVPGGDVSLAYKPHFNVFNAASDPVVAANTSDIQRKFHYDNRRLANTTLSNQYGASQYYSPNNSGLGVHAEFIPDGEGYVYSQSEYTNDGTGRISRQAGVGAAFAMEGDHVSRKYYGSATQRELARLFGSNVGNASHYKKNLAVDPNGQVSVSYLDQEGRTVATALAGDNPTNVSPLASLTALNNSPVTENVITENKIEDGLSRLHHVILNSVPNTAYSFHYDQIENIGCETCAYNLTITITDPDGKLLNLSAAAGNQSVDGLSYQRNAITAASCSVPTIVNDINFTVTFSEIGDYTITKTLSPVDVTVQQMKTTVLLDANTQARIQQITNGYTINPADCAICTTYTAEANAEIDKAIDEISDMDCQNIYQQIIQSFQTRDSAAYEPTQTEIQNHELYCKYVLCDRNKTSDAFDKRLARIYTWSDAVAVDYNNPIEQDPFFNVATLSGFNYKSTMQNKLNDVFIATVGYDTDGDGEQDGTADYHGAIEDVTDPLNTDYYVNENGVHDVTGRHLLYMDLMAKRSGLGEAEFQSQLDQQRWVMYRNYYLEAKRKTKLTTADYTSCPKAIDALQTQDNLPSNANDIAAWAAANGVTDSVNNYDISQALYNIHFACDTTFNATDSTAIASHLTNYFNSNPKNIFHIILSADVGVNPELIAVQSILTNYGCGLGSLKLDDPMACLNETTVTISKALLNTNFHSPSEQLFNQSNLMNERLQEIIVKRAADRQAVEFGLIPANVQPTLQTKTKSAMRFSTLTVKQPSQAEYDALWAFWDSTNGPGWSNQAGWSSADRNVLQDVTGWFGVQTNSAGHVTGIDMAHNFVSWLSYCNGLTGTLPPQIGDLQYLQTLNLACNNISGNIPGSLQNLTGLVTLDLSGNSFSGTVPGYFVNFSNLQNLNLSGNALTQSFPLVLTHLTNLHVLSLRNCGLTGNIPGSIGKLTSLEILELDSNAFVGAIPDSIGYLVNITDIGLSRNQLTSLPTSFSALGNLNYLDLSHNKLEGNLPPNIVNTAPYYIDVSYNQLSGDLQPFFNGWWIYNFFVHHNKFTFSDLLGSMRTECGSELVMYASPQDSVDTSHSIDMFEGRTLTLTTSVDRTAINPCYYQWFKDGSPIAQTPMPSLTGHSVTIPHVTLADAGDYYVKITNDDYSVTCTEYYDPLVLWGRLQKVKIGVDTTIAQFTLCLAQDTTNTTYKKFTVNVDWNLEVQKCLDRAQEERQDLTNYAIDNFVNSRVADYYKTYTSNCLTGVAENLQYSYTPKEYHYTLYYYDQSSNLVKTVPPNGVSILSEGDVNTVIAGGFIEPSHSLFSVYTFNSLNQVIAQTTPDAGRSQFWYNDKGQLRLSQNAQQAIDTLYSYTRYDALGRINEVGELFSDNVGTILPKLDSLTFPRPAAYALSDVTITHYDFANSGVQSSFPQEDLRTRVSWVEVTNKLTADTVKTFYSYDVHGNVKALLQQLPGFEAKRVDYVYDLISGKVNYVMYQYDKPDQFIHAYAYDADNRLTEVRTSTDAFIFNREALYSYYMHGPLARTELGQYRVQALDYYYTLQGWIKGVNTPYSGNATMLDQNVGTDAFAYTLGYFQDDYKPIDAALIRTDNRDQLWTRLNETMGHGGLYNGNISHMVTDLTAIGTKNNNRAKGMQAMMYQYDQLHRLIQSRSLTNYSPGSGFLSRSGSMPYDENYSYDPNGNILTLARNNETGSLMDDFHYEYYTNTNKLKQVKPLDRDKVINGGEVYTDNILYRNITVQGNSYVSAGRTTELKALSEILLDPDFDARLNSDFWAHIVDDEGVYQYDAIGNLILDQDEGMVIRWTTYGKVKEVLVKGDSLIISFKYDASGNRIEKKVTTRIDTVSSVVSLTRYVRDAGGNILATYKDSLVDERPIYGSNRLGQYIGTNINGQLSLGGRTYELSNHLSNVLVTFRDNVYMNVDSVWIEVASASDYYPYGLIMSGRSYNDITRGYRYGFNGMEESSEIGFYTTEFRQYNPRIARWLTIDPLSGSMPWMSPYANNNDNPIYYIDPTGLVGDPPSKYKIKKNDTFWDLAKASKGKYSVNDLKKWNAGVDPNKLKVGQVINVSDPNARPLSPKIPKPNMISRKEWGAAEPAEGNSYTKVEPRTFYKSIAIHHAGNDDSPSMAEVQAEHMEDGFNDIAYHFGIDLKGNIYEGRPLWKQGASVGPADKFGVIGIVILGDMQNDGFTEWSNDKLTNEAYQSLIKLVSYLSVEYRIKSVGGHLEIYCNHTVCPGNQIVDSLDAIRLKVKAVKPACLATDK